MMRLSIIILNYNTCNLLRLCLQNLKSLNLDFAYEIIVVDNASGDKSAQMVKENFPQIKLISSAKNLGHAQGNNLGIKQAQGDYLLILNTDIIFKQRQDFNAILEYLDQHPDTAILGPRLTNGDGTIQNSCYRPYNFFTPIYRRTPLGKLSFARQDLARHLMWDFDHQLNREVSWLLGACLFVRRSFILEFGAFNPDFFLYFADYELCDRAQQQGYKVIYYANAQIVHYHKRESAQGSIWGGFGSILNYTTRTHLRDWLKYLTIHNKYDKAKR